MNLGMSPAQMMAVFSLSTKATGFSGKSGRRCSPKRNWVSVHSCGSWPEYLRRLTECLRTGRRESSRLPSNAQSKHGEISVMRYCEAGSDTLDETVPIITIDSASPRRVPQVRDAKAWSIRRQDKNRVATNTPFVELPFCCTFYLQRRCVPPRQRFQEGADRYYLDLFLS